MNSMENPSQIHEIRRKSSPEIHPRSIPYPWKSISGNFIRERKTPIQTRSNTPTCREVGGFDHGSLPDKHDIRRKSMPDPWKSSWNPWIPWKIHSRSMKTVENPVQIQGNPSEIHEIRRKSMRCLSAPFGRRQNSIGKKKAQREVFPGAHIHEICRKSMADPWKSVEIQMKSMNSMENPSQIHEIRVG